MKKGLSSSSHEGLHFFFRKKRVENGESELRYVGSILHLTSKHKALDELYTN